ncbi:MAG: hypothetical protein ACPG47_01360 [Leucothrix sp.]
MKSQGMNTHTQYNHHARELQKANEAIIQTNKYLLPDSPHYLPNYIAKLEALLASDNTSNEVADKLATAKTNLANYTQRANDALEVIAKHPNLLAQLEASNDIYLTPPEKQDECLYVMDGETCKSSAVNWQAVTDNAGKDLEIKEPESFVFKGKQDIELTGEHQTDALRVWQHNVTVEDLQITDNRTYTEAHRDAVQLIPPPIFDMVEGVYVRLADQMAGAVLENTTVTDCKISAPFGPLQGIFASDGLQRNLCITNNDIGTCGAHAISIAGLLDGGTITGNTLRQLPGGQRPTISLYPARIGGNMADDGVVSILSFAKTDTHQPMEYGEIKAHDNVLIDQHGNEHPLDIDDARQLIPNTLLKLAVSLKDFDYHGYLADYSGLTLGQYKQHDPFGVGKMHEWLTLRAQEFTQGREAGNPLGPVSDEQKKIGARFLIPALEALENGSADNIRLVDLDYTAIRSFSMKRLAIMHGTIDPLTDIALGNERRDLMLKFLLEPEQRRNLVKEAFADATVICVDNGKTASLLPYTLFFGPDHIYNGATDAHGVIAYDELPNGPYILTINNPKFAIVANSQSQQNSAQSIDPTIDNLAQSILKDLANKTPIVKAWLQHDVSNETAGVTALSSHLSRIGATASTQFNDELRHQCMQVMGISRSQRAPFRQPSKVYVSCPQPMMNRGKTNNGCLFAVINLALGLLKKK